MGERRLSTFVIISCLGIIAFMLIEMVRIMRQGRVVIILPDEPVTPLIEGKVNRVDREEGTSEPTSDNRSAH